MKNKKPLMVILIAIIAAVGVSVAYFTTTSSFDNEFDVATYKTTSTEVFEGPTNWTPGQEVPKTVTTKNEGSVPIAVRVSYTENWKDSNGDDLDPQPTNKVTINLDNTKSWIKNGNYYYYKYSLDPEETTSSFMKSVTLNSDAIASNLTTCTTSADGKSKTCEAQDPIAGAHYTLTLTIETAQYDMYRNAWGTDVVIAEKPVSFVNRQNASAITVGDLVKIGATEEFYVVSSDNDKTVLLAKYDINVGDHKNPAVQEGIQDISINGGQSDSSPYGYVSFSSGKYWTMGNYPGSYEDPNYPYVYDANSLVYPYVEAYKEMLEAEDVLINKARLLSYQEAKSLGCQNESCINAPSWVYSSSYWLGSAQYTTRIWGIKMDGSFSALGYGPNVGVRPVIEIDTSYFS